MSCGHMVYLGFTEKVFTVGSVPVQINSQWQQVLLQTKGRKWAHVCCVLCDHVGQLWDVLSIFFPSWKNGMGLLSVDICPVCRSCVYTTGCLVKFGQLATWVSKCTVSCELGKLHFPYHLVPRSSCRWQGRVQPSLDSVILCPSNQVLICPHSASPRPHNLFLFFS